MSNTIESLISSAEINANCLKINFVICIVGGILECMSEKECAANCYTPLEIFRPTKIKRGEA